MKKLLVLAMVCLSASASLAQTGLPRFASIQANGFDNVNQYNLNVEFSIPIISIPGRGVSFSPVLAYNSLIWQKNGTLWSPIVDQNGSPTWGWSGRQLPSGTATYRMQRFRCVANDQTNQWTRHYFSYQYAEANGTVHKFPVDYWTAAPEYPECADANPVVTAYASDASGYWIDTTAPGAAKVFAPSGADVDFGGNLSDTNGNSIISAYVNSNETDWKNSTGQVSLQVVNTSVAPYKTNYNYRDTSGTWNSVTMWLSPISIHTNLGCGLSEYQATGVQLPSRIDLPNGTSYLIQYDSAGRISQITLPTQGYISYTYSGVNCADGSPLNLTRTVNDGTTSNTWTYARAQNGTGWITVVTAPKLSYDTVANQSRFTFDSNGMATRSEIFQGSANAGNPVLLQQVDTTYSGFAPDLVTTTVGAKQKTTDYNYDGYGNLVWLGEYDWGAASPTRTTEYVYLNASNYLNAHILNRPTLIQVHNGFATGTVVSRTEYLYDESGRITLCPTGVPNHDDANYGCSSTTPRGNVTTIKQYTKLVSGSPAEPIVATLSYDSLGNVLTTTVDGVLQGSAVYSSATQYSQPDSVTAGVSGTAPSLTNSFTYNQYTGALATQTDPNGGGTQYAYDIMLRPLSITRPDGKVISYSYSDTTVPITVTATSPLDGASTITSTGFIDKLGRPYKVQSPVGSTNTVFDELGRTYQSSNPYANGSSPSYWTTVKFDGLGRVLTVTAPDGVNTVTNSYLENTVTVTDGAGKQKKQEVDGLGRLVKLYEPDVNNGNSLTQSTTYTYTALDSLATVTQGVQTRTFTYDLLNRSTSVNTPEAGTVSFAYKSGSSLCSRSPANLCSRTDARGAITNYAYDALNRLQQVSYDVSAANSVPATPSVTYSYGTSATLYNNGRLLTMTDGTGSEGYTYDLLGRTLTVAKLVTGSPNQTYTTQYAYNDAGQVKKITYPSGMAINQNVSTTTGMLASITEGPVGTPTKTYLSNLGYNPAGQVTGYTMGASAPITSTIGYSAQRLQLGSLGYAQSGNSILSLSYGYLQNGGNDGQIKTITDLVESGRTATYDYDALNRLTSFSTNGSTNYPAQAMSWTYDRYGNRLTQARSGYSTQTLTPSATTNQLGGNYDASGNMTSDGQFGITWDAEGRMVRYAADVFYAYDGNSIRVSKNVSGTTTVYIRAGAQTLAEYNAGAAPSAPTREFVYGGSQLLASKASGNYKWYVRDHLSPRMVYDDAGATLLSYGHLPFGESWYGDSNEKWRFTSYERDSESGQDYAVFRQYLSTFGRFSAADLHPGAAKDPQSLNRYTYTLGDPINWIDPFGMDVANPGYCDVSYANCGGGGDPPIYYQDGMEIGANQLGSAEFYSGAIVTRSGPSGFILDNNRALFYNLTFGDHQYQWLASGQPTDCFESSDPDYYCPARGYSWVDIGPIQNLSASNNGSWDQQALTGRINQARNSLEALAEGEHLVEGPILRRYLVPVAMIHSGAAVAGTSIVAQIGCFAAAGPVGALCLVGTVPSAFGGAFMVRHGLHALGTGNFDLDYAPYKRP